MLNLKEDIYWFAKAEELVKIVSQESDAQLSLFLTENSAILTRILTDSFFLVIGEQSENIEWKAIHPAREICKDSYLESIQIILESIDLHGDLLLEWSKACALNDSISLLKLIYIVNSCLRFPLLDRAKIIKDVLSNRSISDEGLFRAIANQTISQSIIDIAAQSNSIKVLDFLLRNGTNPNARNDFGATPLMMAIGGDGDLSVIKLLIEKGANPNIVAAEYLILEAGAFSLAIHLEKWDVAEYLYPLISNLDELDWARAHLQANPKELSLRSKFKFCDLLNALSIQRRWECHD
jgi:hypothetical protein